MRGKRVSAMVQTETHIGLKHQTLCFRYKGKSYRATVEICRSTDQIEEFCRQICIRLECCPNMFSPHYVNDSCPENCSQLTKTKYSEYATNFVL